MELIILGHIIGDFYLQTDKIANKKKNTIKYMLLHCAIYSVIVSICFYILNRNIFQTTVILMGILITHFSVDYVKQKLVSKYEENECIVFWVDQVIHIAVLYLIFNLLKNFIENQIIIETIINEVSIKKILIVICAVLICSKPSAIFISLVFKKIPKTIEEAGKENEGAKIGRWIGILEREIILSLGLMGQYGAIGFVLTAKSLARFKQLEEKAFAEKYLVGTLLSAFIAIACIAICEIDNFL